MTRFLLLGLLATFSALTQAQTLVRITNITVEENGQVHTSGDVTAEMPKGEGTDRIILYAAQNITADTWIKVNTHNVRRSSLKDGAVNLMFEIDLVVNGKKDNRRVERIFYAGQERKARISEKFTIKRGLDMRVIIVSYDAEIL
ncbi:MAG: hypothetical protein JNL52_12050 [Flavobacteriales bacterium]|nr:hypothetical protein [Flavobacteriales bacterium]